MPKTNSQMFKSLMKEVDNAPMLQAIFRERIVMIMNITANDIAKNPESYDNPFVSHHAYLELAKIVNKHIGFNND